MNRSIRRGLVRIGLVAATSLATPALAGSALAANTGSIAVWHTPMRLAAAVATTIRVKVPQSTDPIAAVNIYTGLGYAVDLTQAAGTGIGTVEAIAYSRDDQLTLPLSGTIVTADPASAASDAGSAQCTGLPQSRAVWIMNLSVAGSTLAIPVYVNPTAGAEQTLGAYKVSICLPPPDVPVGTPGRSFQGAQLLEAKLTVNGVFTTPAAGGLVQWETLFTPYDPGVGTVDRADTFEARAFVPLPLVLGLHVSYVRKSNTWRLAGRVTEGGKPVGPLTIHVARGLSPGRLTRRSATRSSASGAWRTAGHLSPKKTTYFQASAALGGTGVSDADRDDTALGCQSPLTAFAPAGCVSATLSPWSAKGAVVRLKR